MKISDAARLALAKGKKKQADLVGVLNLANAQVVTNKFYKGGWTANDLAKIATFTGGTLLIRYPDGTEIPVLPEDVE